MAVSVSVTMTQVNEDGSESPVDGELAAALAGPAERLSEMIAWAARDAAGADHGERETVIGEAGRELQLLEATFTNGCAGRTPAPSRGTSGYRPPSPRTSPQ